MSHANAALTPRACLRHDPRPRSVSCDARPPGSPTEVSPSNGYSPTTAPATAPTHGATRAPSSGSRTNAPGPTDRRRTARSSASTAPSPTDGRMRGSTRQRPSVATHYRAGSTSTINTGTTPQSEPHPSADSTTCPDITTRARRQLLDHSVSRSLPQAHASGRSRLESQFSSICQRRGSSAYASRDHNVGGRVDNNPCMDIKSRAERGDEHGDEGRSGLVAGQRG